jgi:hypothetical protein
MLHLCCSEHLPSAISLLPNVAETAGVLSSTTEESVHLS